MSNDEKLIEYYMDMDDDTYGALTSIQKQLFYDAWDRRHELELGSESE